MCKILTIVDASKVKIDDRFLNIVKNAVCKSDRDGFGYSVQGEKGLYGERTLDTNSQFKSRLDILSKTIKATFIERKSNTFGKRSKAIGSFIAHGRMSTNSVSLPCTHPFVENDIALIHNGVVRDMATDKIPVNTANDTEVIFQYWLKYGLEGIVTNVSGYYALSIQDGELTHVIRDDRAQLVVAWSSTIQSYIFATSEEILTYIASKMKWNIEANECVKDCIHIVFRGNEVVHETRFVPRKAEVDAALVARSIGWIEKDADERDDCTDGSLTIESGHAMDEYETRAYDEYSSVQEYLSGLARKQ